MTGLESKYYFDKAKAERPIIFLENRCKHMKGELGGQYIILEEWQKKIIRDIYGTLRRETGTRRYRTVYIEVPKKNGKTIIMAGLGLYMLLADDEKGPEVYTAAADKDQAGISYEYASFMSEADPELAKRTQVFKKSIYAPSVNGTYRSLSRESKTKHGYNPSCIIIDEFHIHVDDELAKTLMAGVASRKQPLTYIITTAGIRSKTNPCWRYHVKAEKIIDGTLQDDSFYAVIYSASEDDDPYKEKTWIKANPTYPISPTKEYLQDQIKKCQTEPTFLSTFKQLHLNIWQSKESSWIGTNDWRKCNLGGVNLEGKTVAAVDLASTLDFTALAAVCMTDGIMQLRLKFYIPKGRLERRSYWQQIQVWAADGWITLTPGNATDYDFVKEDLLELAREVDLVEIAFDPWNSTQFAGNLIEEGLEVIEFRQGYKSLSPAAKEFERLIMDKKINHGGNPVLEWMMSNVVLSHDPAGNIKPDKSKSEEKIDGVIASLMGINRLLAHEEEEPEEIERGLIEL